MSVVTNTLKVHVHFWGCHTGKTGVAEVKADVVVVCQKCLCCHFLDENVLNLFLNCRLVLWSTW